MIRGFFRVFPSRAAVREFAAGGISSGRAWLGLTAPAGGDNCTCDGRFFPDELDVDCPVHGLHAYFKARLLS